MGISLDAYDNGAIEHTVLAGIASSIPTGCSTSILLKSATKELLNTSNIFIHESQEYCIVMPKKMATSKEDIAGISLEEIQGSS